jgi:hypothetical protein
MANYDSTQVGVPYVRGTQVVVNWPDGADRNKPIIAISQCMAVKLADGSVRNLETIAPLVFTADLVAHGNDPVPIVDPSSGAALGPNTTLNSVMVQMLAIIRQQQIASGM